MQDNELKLIPCKNCNYLLLPIAEICPNCLISKYEVKVNQHIPHRLHKQGSLIPLRNDQLRPIAITDQEKILNRSIINENDYSLSMSQHAKISYSDGKWYIENTSSNKMVFVEVKGKVEITPDQMIILGTDNLFQFQEDQG